MTVVTPHSAPDIKPNSWLELSQRTGKSDAELLVEAAHAMHSTLKLTELYDLVLSIVIGLTRSECAVLLLNRPRTHHPVIFKMASQSLPAPVDLPRSVGRDFLDWLRRRERSTRPFEETPVAVSETIAQSLPKGCTAMRWVQMTHHERLLGAVGFLAGEGGFDQRALSLMGPLTEQATIALDNAILYRQVERNSLENQILLEASRMLMSSLDLDEILEAIMDTLQRAVPYNAAGIFLLGEQGEVERIIDRGYDREHSDALSLKAGVGLVGWVASTGRPLIIDDVLQDARYQRAREATRSEMVVPIFAGDRLIGAFNLERDIEGGFFEADLDLVQAFAQHAGVAIERARMHAAEMEQRRLHGELEVARSIQKDFLPAENPAIPGYEVAGLNIPSEAVGGDYYDFIPIVEGQTGIVIADSSGKGIPAALIMAAFRASLIAEIRNNYALHTIMGKVNQLLCERNDKARFVTTIYGVLDSTRRVFTFTNAGHNPGILLRADGTTVFLQALGTALGIFPSTQYEEAVLGLNSGDVLLLYTDGVTDAVDAHGEAFEMERLIAVLKGSRDLAARQILDKITDTITRFADPESTSDDFTMVVIRAH
ncbi:MAG: GAF domain-containing SpoIIE family protein phosphatase [Candidatus Zixiibacteriota bacterium]